MMTISIRTVYLYKIEPCFMLIYIKLDGAMKHNDNAELE